MGSKVLPSALRIQSYTHQEGAMIHTKAVVRVIYEVEDFPDAVFGHNVIV